MENRLKRLWQTKQPSAVTWLLSPAAYSAEVMSHLGWDGLIVDLQHGVHDYQTMVACLQAMQAQPVTKLVRVPANEPGIIGKALDAGAQAIICPMVETGAEAEALVRACKYPPRGARSNGPVRAGMYPSGSAPYQATANDETLVIAMVETRTSVANIDDILAVEGIDSIYIGPTDLGLSMGLPPILDRDEPEILAIYADLIDRCGAAGIAAGIHAASTAYARRMLDAGFRWVSVSADSVFMAAAAGRALAELRA